MNGVDNMLYMMSTNANDGTMTLKVTYDVGTNVDIDQVNTQNRVSQASPNLPTSVNQYGVTVKKLMGLPLLVLAVYSPNGTYNGQFLGNYATINVNDALLRVQGVGQVTNFGAADYAMRIWVKPDQLTKLGIDCFRFDERRSATERRESGRPDRWRACPQRASSLLTPFARRAGSSIAEDFGNIIVRQNPDGSTVTTEGCLADRAGFPGLSADWAVQRKTRSHHCVYQAPGSNALAVAKQVKEQMEELKSRFPRMPGIRRCHGHDSSHYGRNEGDRDDPWGSDLSWSSLLYSSSCRIGARPLSLCLPCPSLSSAPLRSFRCLVFRSTRSRCLV